MITANRMMSFTNATNWVLLSFLRVIFISGDSVNVIIKSDEWRLGSGVRQTLVLHCIQFYTFLLCLFFQQAIGLRVSRMLCQVCGF